MAKVDVWEELEKLHATLGEIEKAFYQIAAHDSDLQAFGLRKLARWYDLSELLPLLDAFPLELANCKRIIEIFDSGKYDQLTELLRETKLEELITRFSVKLRIALNESPTGNPIVIIYSAIRLIFQKKFSSDLFSSSEISMEGVLSAITRIKSLLIFISNELKERHESDDEIFKPSNINITNITVEIDAAITNINQADGLKGEEREKLIEYLGEEKAELTKKVPSWRKVVGALVISATLLGGAAVAPQAADNINKAITYILGTSIPHTQERKLTLPKDENAKKQEPYTTCYPTGNSS